MRSRAYAATSPGSELTPWVHELPPPGPFDCTLRVQHCGICHSDLHMIDNDWRMSRYPLVPGHEIVAEVVEVGTAVPHLRPGDRVGVGWQRSACLRCPECLSGNENLCDATQGVITHGHGGFADHLTMDARFCFPLPDGVPAHLAGPLLCGGVTVFSALRHAGLRPGDEVGVIGVGGLGHLAVQFAARLGARVTVFTSSADKAEQAARLGAHEAVLTPVGQPLPERLPRALNLLLSTVPASLDWNGYLNLLGADGTLALVGVPAGPFTLGLDRLLFKRRRVMASPIGGRSDMLAMLRVADRFGVAPLVESFPLAECNQALGRVRSNQVRYRAVLDL